ncbi:30S ribosomal protein S9 [Candidatus Pacearchaeota archaeon CG10_big_fil_rev_8_21_14_0_10_30_48]|nr:MAG: 30S ribosomal protein S9 [Candidatus Pacearchaeota archaeon CG10_big_fil_rev_8_21_14_0_10_30_48]
MKNQRLAISSGKRKTSIAKTVISEGKGTVTINNIPHTLLNDFHRLSIEEPIRIAKSHLKSFNFDIRVKVVGGGREGQIDAARLSISKALIEKTKSPSLKKALEQYDRHLVVADVRRKEAYKPGDSKARAKRQSSKR